MPGSRWTGFAAADRSLIFAAWTLVALAWALTLTIQLQLPFTVAFSYEAVDKYTLALLMIPVARVAAKLGGRRIPPLKLVAMHVGVAAIVLVIWKGIVLGYLYVLVGTGFWKQLAFASSWLFQLLTAATVYAAALGLVLTIQAGRRERRREQREAAVALTAREAELSALKARLHPHFLDNALNAIVALIDRNPREARAMVLQLAELLQTTRRELESDRISLARELELALTYLEIEQVRFGPRLSTERALDPDAARCGVPPLILLPLVENAIKHGIAPCRGPGVISLTASCQDGMLIVRVSDSGGGADPTALEDGGAGLELTRRRLHACYPREHHLAFRREGGRFVAELRVPATPL